MSILKNGGPIGSRQGKSFAVIRLHIFKKENWLWN